MKRETTALRLYGERDLRLESFPLPPTGDDEILLEIVTNSVCMSDHKAAMQGARHKRVPDDVASNPIIIGHEFCGRIVEVGRAGRVSTLSERDAPSSLQSTTAA